LALKHAHAFLCGGVARPLWLTHSCGSLWTSGVCNTFGGPNQTMVEADTLKHKDAYVGRKSESTRNPHAARPTRRTKPLAALGPEERVLEQWRQSTGCPVSDEAKVQFQVHALENVHRLADVRLWTEHHEKTSKRVQDTGVIYLEFFYDGSPQDYLDNQDIFTKAFEQMIERQLQERRIFEFRQKFAARRRGGQTSRRDARTEDASEGGGEVVDDEVDWKEYLKKPVPATNLSVRALREAGCCLTFLVVQTSLSISACEVLGQITFQEHFPIDGVAQEEVKTDKPLPWWVKWMYAFAAILTFITLYAWWQVMRSTFFPAVAPVLGAGHPAPVALGGPAHSDS